ncbi:hypothetical protein EYM_05445 [Ignicoccus islandicus DSM 13165]|uniref:Polymerase nucleotidyl transferase domain-containing protein n=1 Tax=Ignicoccus islandicus DSM 13165 TaxID=940295 RepID=A0A0U3DYF8_9CREN|nr:hypothetical protein [Ignicoccus islandicus]ALU12586.1 hypothetical protein EYM_05445 [Ignicoccus islandicus DSM 13165]
MLEDKRSFITRNLEVRVSVGYEHPPGCVIAYLKYVYTGRGLWRGFERVIPSYDPLSVRKGNLVYDPNFSSEVPCVDATEVLWAPHPLKRMGEVIASPKDELEGLALDAYSNLGIKQLGLGGSLLLSIHHDNSDLDFLIYPVGDPMWIWEELESSEVLEEEKGWIWRVSKSLGIPLEDAKSLYSKAKRAVYRNKEVSFAFVKEELERYGNSVSEFVGRFEGTLELEPCERGLYYPHRCWAGKYLIESYESAFAKVFVKGGKVRVRGALYEKPNGEKVIRVGVREERGYLLFGK